MKRRGIWRAMGLIVGGPGVERQYTSTYDVVCNILFSPQKKAAQECAFPPSLYTYAHCREGRLDRIPAPLPCTGECDTVRRRVECTHARARGCCSFVSTVADDGHLLPRPTFVVATDDDRDRAARGAGRKRKGERRKGERKKGAVWRAK